MPRPHLARVTPHTPDPGVAPPAESTQEAYWELEAELHPAAEELWSLFCFQRGALGAEWVRDTGPQHTLRHSFAAEPDTARWLAEFEAAYPSLPAPMSLAVRQRAIEPWETAWRRHFTPLHLGRRLRVAPPWEPPPEPPASEPPGARNAIDIVSIVIDPGQGFGTGWHASTALALELLEAVLDEGPPPPRMLDVGTGSGILALAARLLGAGAAVALDVDAQALPDVLRNAGHSGVHPAPWRVQGRPDCLRGAFPLVVANIVSEVLLLHRAQLAGLTAPGGCLILSGILLAEQEALLAAYAADGLRPAAERRRDGWVALALRRS